MIKEKDNKMMCVGGGKDGPTFDANTFDYYYYREIKKSIKKIILEKID